MFGTSLTVRCDERADKTGSFKEEIHVTNFAGTNLKITGGTLNASRTSLQPRPDGSTDADQDKQGLQAN